MATITRRECAKCGKNRQEKFFRTPRSRVCKYCQRKGRSRSSHGKRIEKTYGISREEYEALRRAQGGVCAICGGARNYRLDVDHDHKKEQSGVRESVRGLLCKRCNRQLLPAAYGDPELLRAAAAYLENPPAQRLLKRKRAIPV